MLIKCHTACSFWREHSYINYHCLVHDHNIYLLAWFFDFIFWVPNINRDSQRRQILVVLLFWEHRHAPCFHHEEKITLRHHVDVEPLVHRISWTNRWTSMFFSEVFFQTFFARVYTNLHTWAIPYTWCRNIRCEIYSVAISQPTVKNITAVIFYI